MEKTEFGFGQEQRQQGSLPECTEIDRTAVTHHLEIAEYPKFHPSSSNRTGCRVGRRIA